MGGVRDAMDEVNDAPSNTVHRVSQLPHRALGASALFASYTEGDARALQYFAHDPWRAAARAEAARRAAAQPRDRETLADALLDQNAAWWGEEEQAVRTGIERLRDPKSVAIVTGQQLGLFGGPLYTVYKALTAARLAERLEAETGRPAVPVFWLADEDHDFAEVHTATVLDRYDLVRLAYEDGQPPEANRGPVGRLVLEPSIAEPVTKLAKALALPAETTAFLQEAWRPGARWRDAFAGTLRHLTTGAGLVFLSADDVRLKRLAAPLIQQEIAAWPETLARLESVSKRLTGAGFHAQIAPSPVNLFLFHEGQRLPIDPDGEAFVLRGTSERFSPDDLQALSREAPDRFSPNVVLRPVMQDALLPTAAYVAGPGEAAYFAQLQPVYEAFEVPMPVIYPRASLTLVPDKIRRHLDHYNLSVLDLLEDLDALHRRLALAHADADLDAAFREARHHLVAALDALRPTVTTADASLDRAVEAARARALKALARLEKKTVRVEKQKQHVIRERLERIAAVLRPGGAPQERTLSPLWLETCLGSSAPARLSAALSRDTRAHTILDVP